jgi:hypothetical protein
MATIVTRSGKGSPLTHTEMDANFTNLDADKAGYTTAGDGGAVIQGTSKSTTVVLNNKCGKITMHSADLAADTTVSFTLTNNTIEEGDVLILNHIDVGDIGSYLLNAKCADGSATIYVRNITSSALENQAIVIGFALVQARHD